MPSSIATRGRNTSRTQGRSNGRGIKTTTIAVTLVAAILLIAGLGYISYREFFNKPLDTLAYRDKLISVANGDLPAPPFIGWEQRFVDEPPAKLTPNEAITEVNKADCEPGGKRQQELDGMIMSKASRWSGTELFNAAYNSQIRVDASDAFIESNGLDYGIVDRWLKDCDYVTFNKDNSTVRITNTPLDVDMSVWNFEDGRAWVQTVSTTTPEGFQGSSSTITTIGNAPGVTLKTQLTFRGRADDNAINTMDLLWSSQAAKALQKQSE